MTEARKVADKLSDAQKLFLTSDMLQGSSRGLVARGLIQYRWGSDASFGYKLTLLGAQVVKALAE